MEESPASVSAAAAEVEEVDGVQVTHGTLQSGNQKLHFVKAGPDSGDLVLLLHGFPNYWFLWKYQLQPLTQAGFRVVAPDLRGYNQSDKPAGVENYSRAALVGDVKAMVDQLNGGRPINLVGHDWGGIVAYSFAAAYPDLVKKLVIMNAPYGTAFWKVLLSNPRQLLKSYYIFIFQVPKLAERFFTGGDNSFPMMRKHFGQTLSPEDVDRCITPFKEPNAVLPPLLYYRAIFQGFWNDEGPRPRKIPCPTLVLWGEEDAALEKDLAHPPEEVVPNATVMMIPKASHWAMWDAKDVVNTSLVDFLLQVGMPLASRL